jgi:MFS family permease
MPAAGYASIFALYFVLGAFVTLVPLHLQVELGATALVVGLSFAVFAVLSLLFHYPGGMLADRYGPATPATIGLVAVAIAMALIPTVRDLPGLVALMVIFGVGHGFVFPAASTLVSREADPEQHGLVTGLFYALLVAGVAVGAPAMAALGSVTSTRVGIWASAWVSLVGIAFLARALISPMPNRSSDPRPVLSDGSK